MTRLRTLRPGAAAAARIALATPLACGIGVAATTPLLAPLPIVMAALIAAVTFWRPGAALVILAVVAPIGQLFATFPATAVELFTWTFLATWLLAVWRPLVPADRRLPALLPIGLFLGVIAASWFALALRGAAGVPLRDLPFFLSALVPADYLVFSTELAATRVALQTAAGLVLLVAAAAATKTDRRLVRWMAMALVASGVVLTIATVGEIVRLWAGERFAAWFILRYVLYAERFTIPPGDLNAAGSLHAMAFVAAVASAWCEPAHRWKWTTGAIVVLTGLLLSGSRTAFVATAIGMFAVAAARRGWRIRRRDLLLSTAVAAGVVLVAAALGHWGAETQNAPTGALDQRRQFTQSTLAMLASQPIYGVGVGQYFDRSAEFFTPALRETYGNENAHNYYLQQFAELGVAGGILFLITVLIPAFAGWRAIRANPADTPMVALGACAATYLVTCLTGHPLLVPEMAMPFWMALGTLAGGAATQQSAGRPLPARAAIVAVVALILAAQIVAAGRSYRAATAPPRWYGFHEQQVEDGMTFQWTTKEAVAYIGDGPGYLRVTAMAPAPATPELPYVLEVSVAGRVVDRRELPAEEWVTYEIPIRTRAFLPFRRVDLRLNQVQFEGVSRAGRPTRRPLGVRVAELVWHSAT